MSEPIQAVLNYSTFLRDNGTPPELPAVAHLETCWHLTTSSGESTAGALTHLPVSAVVAMIDRWADQPDHPIGFCQHCVVHADFSLRPEVAALVGRVTVAGG